MRYVEVAVYEPKVQGVFHYHLPPELSAVVAVGSVVVVPFGARQLYGVVLRFVETPAVPETRPVLAVPVPALRLTPLQIRLAEALAAETLAPLAACIGLMLPPGALRQADTRYALTAQAPAEEALPDDVGETARRVLRLLRQRGALRGRQLDRALPRQNWRAAMAGLRRRGWVVGEPVLPQPSRPRQVRMVRLAVSAEEALALPPERLAATRREHLAPRRQRLLRLLAEQGPRPQAALLAEAEATPADVAALERLGLVARYAERRYRDPLANMVAPSPDTPPPLTAAQQDAWEVIRARLAQAAEGTPPLPVLLHGVTGSGKTELYLRAAAEAWQQGRQVAVLVPEIALTPQTVQRFRARFPTGVGVLHSALTARERYDTWLRVRRGDIRLLIGPRSALFAPFRDLGLIVVDECHEEAYYEAERLPHYHAREVALLYGRLASAAVLLGSATPDVVTYARARRGRLTLLELPTRILAHRESVAAAQSRLPVPATRFRPAEGEALAADLPLVTVVDMRAELRAGHAGIFSRALLRALAGVLQRGEQAILFLNRRGSGSYVFCRDCGHVFRCPHCDLPLVYHREDGMLWCHHCGYRRKMPSTCPVCGSRKVRPYGAGTERVEAEVQRHFPHARTLRWDADTVRARGGHAAILEHFVARRADILIGTQMLAKGLDLPFVTLVGIVLADVGLTLPDYRAAERGFQVLTQVAGRAGRSPLGGEVILQTYMPRHYAIRAAARHDFGAFYAEELGYRRRLGYPPYTRLARLIYRGWREERVEKEARRLAATLRRWLQAGGHVATQIIGPAPCFFARQGGRYCWHIVLRGPAPAAVLRDRPLGDWDVALDPPSLL